MGPSAQGRQDRYAVVRIEPSHSCKNKPVEGAGRLIAAVEGCGGILGS